MESLVGFPCLTQPTTKSYWIHAKAHNFKEKCKNIQHNRPEGNRVLHWTASSSHQATVHGVKEQTMGGWAPFRVTGQP